MWESGLPFESEHKQILISFGEDIRYILDLVTTAHAMYVPTPYTYLGSKYAHVVLFGRQKFVVKHPNGIKFVMNLNDFTNTSRLCQ